MDGWQNREGGRLHTWGRNLIYYPHIHYLVPAGGVTPAGTSQATTHNFFLPAKVLSRIFRAKFRDALRQTEWVDEIPVSVWQQEWVVHCKPVCDGVAALKYLALYFFRVAISNRRILGCSRDKPDSTNQQICHKQKRPCPSRHSRFSPFSPPYPAGVSRFP